MSISRASTRRDSRARKTPLRRLPQSWAWRPCCEGSVRRAGGTGTDHRPAGRRRAPSEQLWAETYDRDARDVLDVQSDVASKVAAALAVPPHRKPSGRSSDEARPTNPQAYDAYLRGLSKVERVWSFESANTLQDALAAAEASAADFERAVALDPNYATAHARPGSAYLDLGLYLDANNPAWLPKARGELDRALELEPALALPRHRPRPACSSASSADGTPTLRSLSLSAHGRWTQMRLTPG